mmetsp:Transcript_11776/g.28152  ORF Transcript_11776/g.28152 Transcript_11776/m.28152 type:complete len:82 (-) Transcript_11776:259-504(-)
MPRNASNIELQSAFFQAGDCLPTRLMQRREATTPITLALVYLAQNRLLLLRISPSVLARIIVAVALFVTIDSISSVTDSPD